MSDFAPGFVSRHALAADVLQRAFAASNGFAMATAFEAVDIAAPRMAPVREPAAGEPRHFSPAEPGHNPTHGWDPFDPDASAAVAADFVDPIQAAHEAGFAEGVAAARAELEASRAREQALLSQVSEALAGGAHFDRERMAGHLRQTVLHLVTRMVGEIGVAAEVLAHRIDAAVDLLAESSESAMLRLHPDDVALVEGRVPSTVFAVGDPHIARGAFVLESASTIVEDGPDSWLEQLAQAIDRVPIPPAC